MGCRHVVDQVDPTNLYGQWAAEWPSASGATAGGVSCGVLRESRGVYCLRFQLAIGSGTPGATDVEPRLGEYVATIDYASFGCRSLPWSAGAVSDVLIYPVDSRVWGDSEGWPDPRNGTFHIGWYWADDYRRRLLTCRLESADVLVCTEIEDSYGPNFVHRDEQFRFQRVPALNEPMLCDRIFEEALLMEGLEYPMLGDW